MVVEEGQTPLVVAYDYQQAAYVLFAYGERTTADPAAASSSSSQTPKPSTPYLIETKLDTLPADLKPYLAPYPIRTHPAAPVPATSTSSSGPSDTYPCEPYPPHLQSLTIINSIASGANQSSGIYCSVLQPLLKRFSVPHEYVETTSADTIPNLAKSLVESAQTVLVMGGDTSVVEFANALTDQQHTARQHVNLVCVPTGSGNAISLSIGHTSIAHSLSRLFLGQLKPFANFKVQFPAGARIIKPETVLPDTFPPVGEGAAPLTHLHTFAVASWAFHAALVADSDSAEYRRQYPGVERFKMAAEDNLKRAQSYTLTANLAPSSTTLTKKTTAVRLNGPLHSRQNQTQTQDPITTLAGAYSYLNFLLVNQLEKGYLISPSTHAPSSLDLHLVAVPFRGSDAAAAAELGSIMMAPYRNGSHVDMDAVEYIRVSRDTEATDEEEEVAAAVIAPQETEVMKQRWCLDGQVVLVPASKPSDPDTKKVRIYAPSYTCNGWNLFIVV